MQNRYIFFLFLIGFTAMLPACRSTRKITQVIEPRELLPVMANKDAEDSVRMVREIFGTFRNNRIDCRTFNAKIKVESEDSKGKNPDLTAVVRIVRDSAIWMSLSATILNVEVYRVLITPDSVVLMNKQEKEVQYRSLDYLQEVTRIPFDFRTLQDMILGNPVFVGDSATSFRRAGEHTMITTLNPFFKNLFTLTSDSTCLMLKSKMDDMDATRSRTANIEYGSYQAQDGMRFSTERRITIAEKNKLDVRLSFRQFEFNTPLSLSFTVPRSYIVK